ncbi:MAG: hypothetical protein K4H23_01750 [Mollicutes bacterium PWAP]|nr:hypothetical protein [Mollicutes bacterium PWAP]
MLKKDLFIMIILGIITIGIHTLIIYSKNVKNKKVNTTLSENNKITINKKDFFDAINGKENLFGAEYTHSKVKIFFYDIKKVDVNKLNLIDGISGVYISNKYITIIVGNSAKSIAEYLINESKRVK